MLRTLFLWVGLLLVALLCTAASPPSFRTLAQLKHTRWTTDDGAPGDVRALAQTRDGFLWIASSTGLYRFDGKTFERTPTIGAEASVTALLATRDGRLLVGLQNGHVLLRRGSAQSDVTPSNFAKRISQIVEDRDGGIWVQSVAYDLELVRYYRGRWSRYGVEQGLPDEHVRMVLPTSDGALWVSTPHSAYVLRPGAQKFALILNTPDVFIDCIFGGPGGHVWAASNQHGIWDVSAAPGLVAPTIDFKEPRSTFRDLQLDRMDQLWGASGSHGVFRLTPAGPGGHPPLRIERAGAAEGLSSDTATAILQDREGTIWIGTSGGLDRFRAANVVLETAIPPQSALGYLLFADRLGIVYAADSDTLYRVKPGASPTPILRGLNNPMALCEGAKGDIWLADTATLYVIHGDTIRRAPPPAARSYLHCESGGDHRPWLLSVSGKLFHHGAAGWAELPTERAHTLISKFTFDAEGKMILFHENIGLMRREGASLANIWPVASIPGGRMGLVHLGPSGLLASGVTGLARLGRVRSDLSGSRYPWLQHVTGIAETPGGDTWLHSSLGIYRLQTDHLQRAFDHPGYALQPIRFDALDGLRGLNLLDYADNGTVVGGDGRVWFTTTGGIVWIDPANLHRNAVPPPVAITRVVTEGRSVDAPTTVSLARGAKSLEIDYTALSLAMPERVAFRYRLEGVDEGWVDPGARRQAFYANIPPGKYRFRVIAANEDGVWNRTGASLPIVLPPTFLQSVAFKLLCVAAAMLALWALYRARLERITSRLKARSDVRLAERERIARELHDTLLQGVQGLILRFQGIADRLPREQVPGRLMEKALERAEELLVEGRDRVHGLRSTPPPDDLRSSLGLAIEQADLPVELPVAVREIGSVRVVSALVREELDGIVREALSNVARHARASTAEVLITYGWRRLTLSVVDDGRGIGPKRTRPDGDRHFGIAGMHERAHRIGASLVIGEVGGRPGTRLTVTVSATVAYPPRSLRRLRSLLRRWNAETHA